jgi:SAM-dependent methyltransferase
VSGDERFEANRRNWDERSHLHASSVGYDIDRLRSSAHELSDVVDFDRRFLGDLTGHRVVHLQCHIGTDTLSLARLGAAVVGVDQSGDSLAYARRLFAETGTAGSFVQSNVYDAVAALDGRFDLVYTGVGALNWLPSIERWAAVVAELLAPGGRLYIREGHPMLWALDDDASDGLRVAYPYFETEAPIVFDEDTTYVEHTGTITNTRTYEWNHGLGEIFTALTGHGLTVTHLEEHRGLEWKMFDHMVEEDRQWKLPPDQRDSVPMMYSLIALKP